MHGWQQQSGWRPAPVYEPPNLAWRILKTFLPPMFLLLLWGFPITGYSMAYWGIGLLLAGIAAVSLLFALVRAPSDGGPRVRLERLRPVLVIVIVFGGLKLQMWVLDEAMAYQDDLFPQLESECRSAGVCPTEIDGWDDDGVRRLSTYYEPYSWLPGPGVLLHYQVAADGSCFFLDLPLSMDDGRPMWGFRDSEHAGTCDLHGGEPAEPPATPSAPGETSVAPTPPANDPERDEKDP